MIYRFILISDEVEDFMREIQIDADATFYDLHKAILGTCGYDESQVTSFSLCENGWEKYLDVTLEDMDMGSDQDNYVMSETRLSELLEDERQHLLYTFDPLADRNFFIELSEIITGKSLKAPKISRKQGNAPKQTIDFDELFARNPVQTSDPYGFDDDMYGDGIDAEEIDFEGLDISDGNPYE